jgi:hypothetical protein
MDGFLKMSNNSLTNKSIHLKRRIKHATEFYKSVSKLSLKASAVSKKPEGFLPGVDNFLCSFSELYWSNPKFKSSLLVNLMKAYVSKVDGVSNTQYGAKVLNFFLALVAAGDKKAFEFISGN